MRQLRREDLVVVSFLFAVMTVTVGGAQQPPVSHAVTVQPTGSSPDATDDLFVMQSFHAVGAGDTLFLHEMELVNHDRSPAVFDVDWLPRGQDNTVPPATETITLPGGSAVRYVNVLEEVFGLDPNHIGALRLRSPPSSVQLSHLGFNTGDDGTFGWAIPDVYESQGLVENHSASVLHLSETDDLRSNITCVNMSDQNIRIFLNLNMSDGTLLETRFLDLAPLSNNQINRIFADYSPVEGYVRVDHQTPGALISCNGTVLTNAASDARNEPLIKTPIPATTFYLPRAVHIDGSATSDLVLFAPAGSAQAKVEFLPTGQDNSSPAFVDLVIPDQQEFRLPAVLANLFSHQGTGALRIVPTTGTVVGSAAETKAPSGIDMHRMSQVRPVEDQIATGELASIIHLTEGVDHQTDIGVVNTSADPITVTVDLRDAAGPRLGIHTLQLLPYSHEQIDGVFSSIGFPNVSDGFARVFTTTPGGSFLAYAVVTELNLQDSWGIPAEPMPPWVFADGFESGDTTNWSSSVP